MTVFVQVVDSKTGIYQAGRIEEPVQKGYEIANALKHFGVIENEVKWIYDFNKSDNVPSTRLGVIVDTTKVVSLIITE